MFFWKAWGLEMIFEFFIGIISLKRMRKGMKDLIKIDDKEHQGDVLGPDSDNVGLLLRESKQQFRLKTRKTVRDVLEICICLAFLEWRVPRIIGGLCGTVASISELFDTILIHKKNKNCDDRLECIYDLA